MPDLKQRLAEPGVIVMDGATGTQLQAMGLPRGNAPESWNLENPDGVKRHYQAYIDAGSDAILTNTFGGSRPMLDKHGYGEKTRQINVAAARLAREIAGERVLVLGSMGPTGLLMEPYGLLTYDDAVGHFAEQAGALSEGGVDGIHIETMSDLNEAKAAIAGARQATGLPITATMSFDTNGCTMMGVRPEDAAKELWSLGVLAVVSYLVRMGGIKWLDSGAIRAMLRYLSLFPLGSWAELSTGEKVRVVSSNPEDYMRPVVSVVYNRKGQPIDPFRIDLLRHPQVRIRKALPPVGLEAEDDPLKGF